MANPIILFNSQSKYMQELCDYLTAKKIDACLLLENTTSEVISVLHRKGITVIALFNGDLSQFKGYPYVNMSDITATSFNDIADYVDPFFFSYEDLIEDFKTACASATEVILDIYKRDFPVSYKEDSSPVTEADRKSNSLIVNYLKSKYPDYAFLAEETYDINDIDSRISNPWCIIIDPLDGTKEFVKKNDEFAINIALSYKKRAIAGMIYLPVFNEIYYGARGMGAYHVNLSEFDNNIFNERYRIFVSDRTDNLVAMHSKSNFDKETEELLIRNKHKIKEIISKGSAIKMGKIAEGQADIYYRRGHTMEWDTAAGQIIIEEAGGIMRQLDDSESELLYNRTDSCNRNGFFIVNNRNNRLNH